MKNSKNQKKKSLRDKLYTFLCVLMAIGLLLGLACVFASIVIDMPTWLSKSWVAIFGICLFAGTLGTEFIDWLEKEP